MRRRNYLILDMARTEKYGLSATESILASFLYGLLAQYEPLRYEGESWYLADYEYIAGHASLLAKKRDTIRKLYARLKEAGLLAGIMRIESHVYIRPAQALRDWGTALEEEGGGTEETARPREESPRAASANNSAPRQKNAAVAEKNPRARQKNAKVAAKKCQDGEGIPLYIESNKKTSNIECGRSLSRNASTPSADGKKTLFRNSSVAALADFGDGVAADYSRFEAEFPQAEFREVDMPYYYHAVADWSDQSGTMRTARGWLATVRNFIRGDIEKGKLHRRWDIYRQGGAASMTEDEWRLLMNPETFG